MMTKEDLENAIEMAVKAHKGIYDKTGRPSILHPLRVMQYLDKQDDSMLKEMIVAVLHDTLEDTGLEPFYIQQGFGDEIACAVDAITRRDGEVYMDYIKRCAQNTIARMVKYADLNDNMHRNDGLPIEECKSLHIRYEKARKYICQVINADPKDVVMQQWTKGEWSCKPDGN